MSRTTSASARMASFIADLDIGAVPPDVVRLARLHMADAVGVALAAASVPAHRDMVCALRRQSAHAGPASVLGFGDHAPPEMAALINGTSMHSLEYDDTHMGAIVHGSAVIVPTVLAMAQEQGLRLSDAVRLTIAGWELLVRLGEAAPGGFQRRGFQVTSAGGVIVAALLAAQARGQSTATMTHAAGIAGSQASGIFAFLSNGSNVKALHPGWAAHAAIWASTLAASGMTGPAAVLEDKYGVFAAYAADPDAGERLHASLDQLGTRWALREAAFKFYPCCHYIHPYLEAAEQLREQAAGTPIVAAHCRVAPGAALVIAEPWAAKQQPRDNNEAKYSLPYTVACALLGIPIDVPAMTVAPLNDAALMLAKRVTAEAWDDSGFPQQFGAVLEATLADGRVLRAHIAQVMGSFERPASEQRIQAKFLANAARTVTEAEALRLWDAFLTTDDVAAVMA
ncbi:MmgE/PrpD family protein [Alcaligenaceae bacterium B3P038]|nr:MmgE/PrpD family protein [Alcaligenaceae bacterium B3P038]